MLIASPLVAFSSEDGSASPPSRAAPSVIITSEPTFINTGDPFFINVSATDSDPGDSVVSVVIEHWMVSGAHTNLTMTKIIGLPQYYALLTGELDYTGEFYYIVRATDTFSNVETTPKRTLTVLDNKPPKLVADRTPDQGTTGEILFFDMDASDNILVLDVTLRYHYTGTASFERQLMTKNGGTFTFPMEVPVNSKRSIVYYYEIRDKNPLTTNTPQKTVWVVDNDKPTFEVDQTPNNATTGDILKFLVSVKDNIQVVGVEVVYGYGQIDGTSPLEMPLKPGGGSTWVKDLPIDNNQDQPLKYRFRATDNASNINYSQEMTVEIIDNDLPKIITDITPLAATTGDPIEFKCNLTDNLIIEEAWVTLRQTQKDLENVTLSLVSGITYSGTCTVPDNIDPLMYIFHVRDAQGNEKIGPQRRVEIEDNDNPTFGSDVSAGSKTAGGPYSFAVHAQDNIALEKVLLVYYYGENDVKNATLKNVTMKKDNTTYRVNLSLDQNHIEDLTYYFVAKDVNMNWGHSATYGFDVTDLMAPFLPTITMKFSLTTGTGREHRVTMEVVDNIRLQKVEIVYKFGEDGTESTVAMTGAREWTGLVPIPTEFVGTMFFSIKATDHAGNVNQTIFFNVSVIDVTPPEMDPLLPVTLFVGDTLSIRIKNLSDNVNAVSDIVITWKTNLPFALNGTETGGIVKVPGTFKIDVEIRDRAGNVNKSGFTLWVKEVEIPPVDDTRDANYGPVIAIVVILVLIIIGALSFFIIKKTISKKKEAEKLAEEEAMMREEAALKEAESKLIDEEKKQKDFARLYGGSAPPQMLQAPVMAPLPPATMPLPEPQTSPPAVQAPPSVILPQTEVATGPLPPSDP